MIAATPTWLHHAAAAAQVPPSVLTATVVLAALGFGLAFGLALLSLAGAARRSS